MAEVEDPREVVTGVVSARFLISALAFFKEKGITRQQLAEEAGIPEILVLDEESWVPFSIYRRTLEAAEEHLSEDDWRQAGERLFEARWLSPFGVIIGWTVPSVESAFDWALRSAFGADGLGIRACSSALIRLGPGRLRAVLRPPPGDNLPRGLVLLTEGTMIHLPTLIGSPRAEVRTRMQNQDAIYDIVYKERRFWTALLGLVRWLWPGAAEAARLRDQFDVAMEQSAAARRKRLEERRAAELDQDELGELPQVVGGKYRLVRSIGRGSMGEVFLAQQEGTTRDVAIKFLAVDRGVHSGALEDHERQFLREASTLARLESRNIVRIHDYGIEGERPYLVLQYVDGASLEDLLAGGAIPVRDAERIFRGVCLAMRDAHAIGVVHRDLSPGNVLISALDNKVKVLDFGFAKFLGEVDELSVHGRVVGTPWFVAPEIWSRGADPRSDLYAAGMLLYRMLTGRYPFDASTAEMMATPIEQSPRRFREVAPHRRLPRRLERIALRCLERDPDRRYQSAQQILADLDRSGRWW